MKLILFLLLVTACSGRHLEKIQRRAVQVSELEDDVVHEMMEDDIDVNEVISHRGVPRNIIPFKIPMNIHGAAMELKMEQEDHELDREEKIEEFRKLRPDAPAPSDDEDLDDFHVGSDSNDKPFADNLKSLDDDVSDLIDRIADKKQVSESDVEMLVDKYSQPKTDKVVKVTKVTKVKGDNGDEVGKTRTIVTTSDDNGVQIRKIVEEDDDDDDDDGDEVGKTRTIVTTSDANGDQIKKILEEYKGDNGEVSKTHTIVTTSDANGVQIRKIVEEDDDDDDGDEVGKTRTIVTTSDANGDQIKKIVEEYKGDNGEVSKTHTIVTTSDDDNYGIDDDDNDNGAEEDNDNLEEEEAEEEAEIEAAGLGDSKQKSDVVFRIQGVQQKRKKRYILKNPKTHWQKGLVPFEVYKNYDPDGKVHIEAAMSRYEKYTCIRFVPWEENTKEKYGITHNGRLFFKQVEGCWSHLGNIHRQQPISCCSRGPCLHELGHALGLMHEHQNPQRTGWNRMNYDNIQPSAKNWFYRSDPDDFTMFGYDLSSPMHYKKWGFGNGRGDTQAILFNELNLAESFFYMFHEIVETYNCKGLYCADFQKQCVNDGYVSVIEGKCQCMCPDGLDPETGCSTVIRKPKRFYKWPSGEYALFAADEGCPDGFKFGTVSHYFTQIWHGWKPWNHHLKSEFSKRGSTYGFCVKTVDKEEEKEEKRLWPRGNYCILRKGGICPEGFKEGSVQLYGKIPDKSPSQFTTGETPDGTFGENPLFQFCCMNSGFQVDAIELPNEKPFVMMFYRNMYETCQHVKGMYGTKEKFRLLTLEKSKTRQTFHGVHPHGYQTYKIIVYIPYCYYRPYYSQCGGILRLTRDEPIMTLTSPNYPKNYYNDLKCFWLIKSPPNTTIVLNFDDFDLEEGENKCRDSLEIGHVKIGQPGALYCGDGFERSIHSIFNMIKLTLRTGIDGQKSGFKASFKVIFPDEMCYSTHDHGTSYRGLVNFTHGMESCLPWTDVTMCHHHAFKTTDVFSGLNKNYCRNPGNGFSPWCYTSKLDCVRDYCDVCLTERLYDKVDNCEELKRKGFCSKGPKVISKCALTCVKYFPPIAEPLVYKDIECTRPDHIKDAVLISDSAKRYQVGEVIELKCISSKRITKARCLTSGRWSVGTYVCGACASGWAFHDGFCYKYFDKRLHFVDALKVCKSFQGTLAQIKTEKESQFVLDLREQGKHIWLAATDKEVEGEWRWLDGTRITNANWQKGQPNNYNDEDCALVRPDGTWKDVYCFWYQKHRFVCQVKRGNVGSCKDRRRGCQDLLFILPSFCFDYPDFAKHECRFTCGICRAKEEPVCKLPNPSVNATFVSKMTKGMKMTRGDTFTHACNDGFVRVSGNFIRAVIFCGIYTGQRLMCVDVDDTVGPNNRVELINRKKFGKRYHYYTADTDNFRINRNGEIVKWEFFSNRGGMLSFQVWRPSEEHGENIYELVGENTVRKIPNGLEVRSIDIVPSQRIRVKNGDLIGVYYGYWRSHLPYDPCRDENIQVLELNRQGKPLFKVEDVARFDEDIGCATFSLRAIIAPLPDSS